MAYAEENGAKRVLLIGASVGDAWNIAKLPERAKLAGYTFESVAEYQFDKSHVIEEIVKSDNKPDFVILKECAAYFPGDFPRYKQFIQGWVVGLAGTAHHSGTGNGRARHYSAAFQPQLREALS